MKAITLYQPHATLMAIWQKRIETRPQRWRHRGLVAIHAGTSKEWLHLCRVQPFAKVLAAAGYNSETDLPLGKVIAIGNMVDCLQTTVGSHLPGWSGAVFNAYPYMNSPQERAFGNYEPGRFGYVFSEIRRLKEPIPFTGHQGKWDLPAEWCDGCDGTGLMEGWNRRDGHPCPKCHGNALALVTAAHG